MKDAKNIGMLTAVVFAIGMVGFNLSDGTFALQNDAPSTIDGASIMGHMEIIHTDSEGNILSYQQTDNAIVNEGRNCVTVLLFGPLANTSCDDESPGIYTVVGIGNGTLPSITSSGETTQSDLGSEIADNNMARADGIVTVSQVSASVATSEPAVARISSQFTWLGATTNTVNQAGLFNQTTTGATSGTFALKDFPSDVAMNTNDQLTVNWDITIDGSDAFL